MSFGIQTFAKMLPIIGGAILIASSAWADMIRIASFNASLSRRTEGELRRDLARGNDEQARIIAKIITKIDPDILLINEFDYDPGLAQIFNDFYLGGRYSDLYSGPVNTGIASGMDLNGDGTVALSPGDNGYEQDAFGFGFFPGQYGMAVFSKYSIDTSQIRSFQTFLWSQMPGALRPTNPDQSTYHSDEVWHQLRLSSKSHWDIPIRVGQSVLHLLASHSTPPVFDGEEDRNGRRNRDEIRFWSDYIAGETYMTDDQGRRGGIGVEKHFVIAGDLNADPNDGDSYSGAIETLLTSPKINSSAIPLSDGAAEATRIQGGSNTDHITDPRSDTVDWNDKYSGNLRVDYLLPSTTLNVAASGVFWPTIDAADASLIHASDHRLVWMDIEIR